MGKKEDVNESASELLAQARAVHFAMRNGAISYDDAKDRVHAILEGVNRIYKKLARKHNRKFRPITFQDLGRNL